MILSRRKKYLQVALNSTLSEAHSIINSLPISDRILIEAGTPLIKKYGVSAITQLRDWWQSRLFYNDAHENIQSESPVINSILKTLITSSLSSSSRQEVNDSLLQSSNNSDYLTTKSSTSISTPYVIADLKTMDRADTETREVKFAGASAAVVLGIAPLETLNAFINSCLKLGIDSMVDMMNVSEPYKILRDLRKLPDVVVLHRGVDEEAYNKNKPLPYNNIIKVKGSFDVLISVAGGDTSREVQRAAFNGADIVVVWKDFYTSGSNTGILASEFLKEIK